MAVVIVGVLAAAPSALAGGAVRLAPVTQLAHPFGHAVHTGRTFQMVGVRWKGTGTVRLQARSTSGSWTRWVALSQEAPVWTGPARRVRMRRSGDVRHLAVTLITTPRVASPARGTVIPAVAGRPAIVTRAGWHADESIRRAQPSYAPALKMVFVHHTDTATSAPCSDSARIVRGIYAYHVRTNGWNDIGYNFLVDKCGTVFEGRYGGMTKAVIGAQTKGFNTGSAGIAIIGTYSSARPRPAAVAALERLIAWRLDVAHVDPESRVEMV
ncbi:MAG: N-acetylmuramoyl-L-alanine amidase, partial [Gaiellales bacterium]